MDFLRYLRHQWDRAIAWAAIAAGALAILLGWLGVSRTPLVPEQIPYVVSGGIFGLLLVAVGVMFWLSADLRDEWRRLDDIKDALERLNDSGQLEQVQGWHVAREDEVGASGPSTAEEGPRPAKRAKRTKALRSNGVPSDSTGKEVPVP